MAWGRKQSKEETRTTERSVVVPKVDSRDPQGAPPTILGDGFDFTGEINTDRDMLVLGLVKGKIMSKAQVTIGGSGKVEGGINCVSLVVDGQVVGNVEAVEKVTITKSGRLTGDITTKLFINQPGGFFEGYSHMNNKKGKQENGDAQSKGDGVSNPKDNKKEGKTK